MDSSQIQHQVNAASAMRCHSNQHFVIVFLIMLFLSGCATLFGKPTHVLPINSEPSGAIVLIKDEKGMEVFKGVTPTSFILDKSDGSYLGGKNYMVTIEKSGFETQVIPVIPILSTWYTVGNVFSPYFIGWLTDPKSGNMYNLSPDTISVILKPESDQ